jgi:hypothetical protein
VRRVLLSVLFCALGPLGWMASGSPLDQVGFSRLADTTTTTDPPTTTTTGTTTTTTTPGTTTTATTTTTTPGTTTTATTTTTTPGTTTTATTTTTPATTTAPGSTTTTTPGTTTASGSTTTSTSSEPSPPPPPQATTVTTSVPPGSTIPPNVINLAATVGDRSVKLIFEIPTGVDHVVITRSTGGAAEQVIYTGTATSYTDRGLTNGIEYRYLVTCADHAGNRSGGVAIVVAPSKNLLRTPRNGAQLKKIPKQFTWTRDPRASFYNFQLFAGGTLLLQSTAASSKKILSAFPTKPLYRFKSPWKWQGRRYRLTKGVYTWYVWPGYGTRANAKYGPLMGSATFQLTK